MQKVLRRVELARAQAKRKARILKKIDEKLEKPNDWLRQEETRLAIQHARKNRREDWDLGPLAPNRRGHGYGTFSFYRLQPPDVASPDRAKAIFIEQGDRVCVMRGSEHIRGKIGKVSLINVENQTAIVEGVGAIEIRVPRFAEESLKVGTTRTEGEPIPIKNLNLVYPLPDPETGIPRDCILTNLVKAQIYFDRYKNKQVWSRVLMPQRIRIPWPEEEEEIFVDEDVDTLRVDVEANTFVPTLLRPPMPNGVIDQLRNRNSRYRTRHDLEYVAKKLAEDAVEERQTRLSEAMLPRGARNIARPPAASVAAAVAGAVAPDEDEFNERPKPGTFMADKNQIPVLSDELLQKIGAHMAQNGFNGKKAPRGRVGSPSATLAVQPSPTEQQPPPVPVSQ